MNETTTFDHDEDQDVDATMVEILYRFLSKDWAEERKREAEADLRSEALDDELGILVEALVAVKRSKRRPPELIFHAGAAFGSLYQRMSEEYARFRSEIRSSSLRGTEPRPWPDNDHVRVPLPAVDDSNAVAFVRANGLDPEEAGRLDLLAAMAAFSKRVGADLTPAERLLERYKELLLTEREFRKPFQ